MLSMGIYLGLSGIATKAGSVLHPACCSAQKSRRHYCWELSLTGVSLRHWIWPGRLTGKFTVIQLLDEIRVLLDI